MVVGAGGRHVFILLQMVRVERRRMVIMVVGIVLVYRFLAISGRPQAGATAT
jgi:hypothetical protein